MGWFSGIFELFKKSPKAVDTGLDLITRGSKQIGQMIYTDQEKIEHGLKSADQVHAFVEMTLRESSTRSYTRRVMAWGLVGLGIFLTLWSLLWDLLGRVLSVFSGIWTQIGKALLEHSVQAWNAFLAWAPWIGTAITFYLGVHILRSIGKSKDKE